MSQAFPGHGPPPQGQSGPRPPQMAVLKILTGPYRGKQFRLLSKDIVIGRKSSCDVVLTDPGCSGEHALITGSEAGRVIKSLKASNPVFVNKKPVSSHALKPGDIISIGKVNFLFAGLKAPSGRQRAKGFNLPKKKKGAAPARIIFAAVVLAFAYLYLDGEKKKGAGGPERKDRKTEQLIKDQIDMLAKEAEEESETKDLSEGERAARIAFIKGFRDYRKGFFYRALKQFEHCATLFKNYTLCKSYIEKSRVNLEKLIQKKIILGERYKTNKQFEACHAIFKSVEIMIRDSNSLIFKEARENRKLCLSKLKNRI